MPAPDTSKQKSFSVTCVCNPSVNGIYSRMYASNIIFKPPCTLVTVSSRQVVSKSPIFGV